MRVICDFEYEKAPYQIKSASMNKENDMILSYLVRYLKNLYGRASLKKGLCFLIIDGDHDLS